MGISRLFYLTRRWSWKFGQNGNEKVWNSIYLLTIIISTEIWFWFFEQIRKWCTHKFLCKFNHSYLVIKLMIVRRRKEIKVQMKIVSNGTFRPFCSHSHFIRYKSISISLIKLLHFYFCFITKLDKIFSLLFRSEKRNSSRTCLVALDFSCGGIKIKMRRMTFDTSRRKWNCFSGYFFPFSQHDIIFSQQL